MSSESSEDVRSDLPRLLLQVTDESRFETMSADDVRFRVSSLETFDSSLPGYRRRKAYKKTRSGCLTCKGKKVKCDESHPTCHRCRRNGRPCIYDPTTDNSRTLNLPNRVTSKENTASFSVLSSTIIDPWSSFGTNNGTPTRQLTHHLQQNWTTIFNFSSKQEILELFNSYSVIRNTALAISACHLRHVSPSTVQHQVAEHFQQSLALRDYRQVLERPRTELGQAGVNVLLLSATLLNMLAFTLPKSEGEVDLESSWVTSPRSDRLGWLALQAGLVPLIRSVESYLQESLKFLQPIFLGDREKEWVYQSVHLNLDRVPEMWIRFFELSDLDCGCECTAINANYGSVINQPGHNYIYLAPVKILAQLRDLGPCRWNVFQNLQFLGKVHTELRTLLYERDAKAIWLFGYWLGLMCRCEDVWWCNQRARRDYLAIRLWLQQLSPLQHPNVEEELWSEMMKELELAPFFDNRRRYT